MVATRAGAMLSTMTPETMFTVTVSTDGTVTAQPGEGYRPEHEVAMSAAGMAVQETLARLTDLQPK